MWVLYIYPIISGWQLVIKHTDIFALVILDLFVEKIVSFLEVPNIMRYEK